MRNEIMHTRKPSIENEQKYDQAKRELSNVITEFWTQERVKIPNIEIVKVYLLDTIFDRLTFDFENSEVNFINYDFEQKDEMWTDEFKEYVIAYIFDTIQNTYSISIDKNLLEREIEYRLFNKIESL